MMKCTACKKGRYKSRQMPYSFLGEGIGVFDALVCDKCGDTLFEAEASDAIEAEVKRRGLWGLRARSTIAKVGNALDVRIPKAIAGFLRLRKGKEIVIEPLDRNRLQIIID